MQSCQSSPNRIQQTVAPTKAFTERRYLELDADANEKLEGLGVRQVVAMAEHKGK